MANMWQALKDRDLRRRILVVLGFLALFRFLAIIPIPAFDPRVRPDFLGSNFLGLLNIFSGGALDNVSIVMLGVGPYITASIIMQLFTMIFPSLKEMYQEDGQTGRKKFNQYSRMLAVPLSFLQGYALLALLMQQNIIPKLGAFDLITNLIVVTGGALLLMWIGEVVSEYGIGNGISLLIFAGIVAGVPSSVQQTLFAYDASQLPTILAFLIAAPLIIAGTVIITEAERPIPISYTKRVRGMRMYGGVSTYLPLRVNQAGVIPIIFAISILLFPSLIGNMFAASRYPAIAGVGNTLLTISNNQWIYGGMYFLLVFLFTYFYTSVTFDPDAISSNLQKQGGFIPGIRPGPSTSEYLRKLITRITLVGALFLGAIAVLPLAMQTITGTQALALGGTALLIVVSVVIETIKQVRAQMTLREYD
ncbi:MAG: preprotein translocase subunit SecY [Patescibacteria group bacterium]